MTNLQAQQMVAQLMTQGNKQLTAQAIALGEITSWDNAYNNFQLAVMIVESTHNVWLDGSSVQTLQVI